MFGWKDVAIWLGQFALVEISKKWPKVGEWIKTHTPAALAIVTVAVEVIGSILKAATATAAGADSLTVIPAHPSGDFVDAVATNYVGTLVIHGLLKKVLWAWLIKTVILRKG